MKKAELLKRLEGMSGKEFFDLFGKKALEDFKTYNKVYKLWKEVNNVKEPEPRYAKVGPTKIIIREPIWKDKSIGIAEDKMITKNLRIEIEYTDKQGNRVFPGEYEISKKDALKYPKQEVKGHVLRLIPIKDLKKKPSLGQLVSSEEEAIKLFGLE